MEGFIQFQDYFSPFFNKLFHSVLGEIVGGIIIQPVYHEKHNTIVGKQKGNVYVNE